MSQTIYIILFFYGIVLGIILSLALACIFNKDIRNAFIEEWKE